MEVRAGQPAKLECEAIAVTAPPETYGIIINNYFMFFPLVAPQVRVTNQLIEVRAGQPVKLECEAIAGRPPPEIFWTKQVTRYTEGVAIVCIGSV
jgi:hypothetical protein